MIKLPTPSFDLTHLDLTNLDLGALEGVGDRVGKVARDVTYVAIGFGVLGFQKAQVRRREIEKVVGRAVNLTRGSLDTAARLVGGQGADEAK